MNECEVICILMKAKPVGDSDSQIVEDAHARAVKKAESLIKLSDDPYLMSILVDRYIEGMTFKEIASKHGIGVSTVHRFHGIAIERIADRRKNDSLSRKER